MSCYYQLVACLLNRINRADSAVEPNLTAPRALNIIKDHERMAMFFRQEEKIRLLVVDDDPNMIKLIKFYLINENVDIVSAGDGADALIILKEHTFDLILIDIQMPKMDGTMLLKKIIVEYKLKTPVVVVTAHGPTDNLMQLIEDGAYDILQKPFTTNRLKLTIHNALKYRSLVESLEMQQKGNLS